MEQIAQVFKSSNAMLVQRPNLMLGIFVNNVDKRFPDRTTTETARTSRKDQRHSESGTPLTSTSFQAQHQWRIASSIEREPTRTSTSIQTR
jgi:hypothetical protein